jgi:hypothetical protein
MSAAQTEGNQQGDDHQCRMTDLKWWLTWQYFIVVCSDAQFFKEIGVNYIDKIVRPVTNTYSW